MTDDLRWFKSSYSSDSGGACVEVAYDWFKSSYSHDSGGDCVEVAKEPHRIHIRDSKTPDRARLAVDPTAWESFVVWTSTDS
ncbi:DUF397 domain-containing protein [Streptomyces cavernicola]|uniref:DUF397 domain-containing protein n=1 Tax=Streptomyces cavernicola TaxID=3043613 RepID=A0ABT6SI00_9ACTN|nr:DUF397 domain-containing protein [Streptomyces sp. B-S-A6]MDI3407826.1 DUF397 domain-containing protein [Streptomyces sp. B-S-A6]